jgi:hypothetical protein
MMAREYFTVLGTLSSNTRCAHDRICVTSRLMLIARACWPHDRGLEMMNQHKIFASLGEMQSSSNLSYLSLTSLDYSMFVHFLSSRAVSFITDLCAQWRSVSSAHLQISHIHSMGAQYRFFTSRAVLASQA